MAAIRTAAAGGGRGVVGLVATDAKVLDIIANLQDNLATGLRDMDVAFLVDTLREYVQDMCPLQGSIGLWTYVGDVARSVLAPR